MTSLLIQHATLIVSMDDSDTQWTDGGIYIEENAIQQIGPTDQLPQEADQVINAKDMIILPGLVNTHHHFYQTLTRNVPAAQDANPAAAVPVPGSVARRRPVLRLRRRPPIPVLLQQRVNGDADQLRDVHLQPHSEDP